MNSTLGHLITVFAATLLIGCGEANPQSPGPVVPTTPSSEPDPPALDGQEEAVRSGKAEMFVFERHISRRNGEGTMSIQRNVSLPQLVGAGAGIERINGFLRYLALHWPNLPSEGRATPSESAERMRAVGELSQTLRPEEWPTLSDLEALGEHFSGGYLNQEFYPEHDESAFWIQIVRLDAERVFLRLEIFDASGATTRGYVGDLALDLGSGHVVLPR
jgi:hypothetical protein